MVIRKDFDYLPVAITTEGNVVVLNETFFYPDGFQGATGYVLRPVTIEEFEEETSDGALEEYAEEVWREDAHRPNGTTSSLSEWVQENLYDLIESRFEFLPLEDFDTLERLTSTKPLQGFEVISAGSIFPIAEPIARKLWGWNEALDELAEVGETLLP
jgi:hypothetical protein